MDELKIIHYRVVIFVSDMGHMIEEIGTVNLKNKYESDIRNDLN